MNRVLMVLLLIVVCILSVYFALVVYSYANAKPIPSAAKREIVRPLPCVACVHLRGSQ